MKTDAWDAPMEASTPSRFDAFREAIGAYFGGGGATPGRFVALGLSIAFDVFRV